MANYNQLNPAPAAKTNATKEAIIGIIFFMCKPSYRQSLLVSLLEQEGFATLFFEAYMQSAPSFFYK